MGEVRALVRGDKMRKTPGRSYLESVKATHDESGMNISDVLEGQAGQLITVSGIAFGFLLSIGVTYVFEKPIGEILCALALMCTGSSIVIFLLPMLYIQLHFPMDKKQIMHFYVWSHRFILSGIVVLVAGVYIAISLALYRLVDWFAPIAAAGILIPPLVLYTLRGIGLPKELT
jgi:hypothetical protein